MADVVNPHTSAFPGLAVATDVAPAQWLLDRLWARGRDTDDLRVGSLVPDDYPAYGRLLHPARSAEPNGPARWRWADIAASQNRQISPDVRFNELVSWTAGPEPPWPYHWPIDGSLDQTACHALADILTAFTTRPELCWFCLWDGYGWPELPAPGEGPPRVPLAYSINCLLFQGPVTAACNFKSGPRFQSPTAWWPDDRACCVATDVDGFSTYIAGTRACIDALASDPRLEVVPARAGQEVDPSPYPPRHRASLR